VRKKREVAFGSFFHQGQICMRNNRHLVHRSRYEEYVNKFTQRAASLKWGDPSDPSISLGPVINEKQKTKIMNFIQQSVEQGAKVTTGGHAHGLIIEPTVRDVRNEHPVAQNEVFGPVAPIIAFDSDDEAVELANNTPFGEWKRPQPRLATRIHRCVARGYRNDSHQ
jgi:acyl-CoA reductase-like NAD-dependent aldehyde dehydrogenase